MPQATKSVNQRLEAKFKADSADLGKTYFWAMEYVPHNVLGAFKKLFALCGPRPCAETLF